MPESSVPNVDANDLLARLSGPPRKRQRIHLTSAQQTRLVQVLETDAFPSKERRSQLATELGIEARTVQIWFQNQRQKVRKTARIERERFKNQHILHHPPPMMCWAPVVGPCPPPTASPRLSYSGPDHSPELNALVDAAMEELAKTVETFSGVADRLSDSSCAPSSPPQPTQQPQQQSKTPDFLRSIPEVLLRSPKFRPRASKSMSTSPKLKTLQPRSQPNSGGKDTSNMLM